MAHEKAWAYRMGSWGRNRVLYGYIFGFMTVRKTFSRGSFLFATQRLLLALRFFKISGSAVANGGRKKDDDSEGTSP